MAPFGIVEHFPPLCSSRSVSFCATSFYQLKLGNAEANKGRSSPACSEHTTATLVSLDEASGNLLKETVEVIHKHDSNSSPSTVIATNSLRSVMSLQLDRFGFIVNIDSKGHLFETNGDEAIRVPTFAEAQRIERREQKWNSALLSWDTKKRQKILHSSTIRNDTRRTKASKPQLSPSLAAAPLPSKVILRRLRKGVPDSVRGRVWIALGGGVQKPGLYQEIVHKTSDAMLETYREMRDRNTNSAKDPLGLSTSEYPMQEDTTSTYTTANSSNRTTPTSVSTNDFSNPSPGERKGRVEKSTNAIGKDETNLDSFAATRDFRSIQDTIERDIHRTYPRHNLFYEEDRHKEQEGNATSPPSSPSSIMASGLCDPELAALILNLETDIRVVSSGETSGPISNFGSGGGPGTTCIPGGQAALRRVLRAYSYYDPEVGYCQGMNFIAGMFLTVMSEEEAFWLLVAVMNDAPCNMRGMFGEGMKETHKVLYIAEKLMHHYLPRLARHLEKENVHITMYATQWLLTQYTSSFRFDLVFRVWDCFLGEGWKIIYRVMLALLQKYQSKLLKMSFEEILTFFRELPERVEANQIIEIALKIPLRGRVIARHALEWEKQNKNSK